MGWANCGEDDLGRPIGYAHAATCDYPGCEAEIDRGLSYVCGGMHGGDGYGCGRYFCSKHRQHWIPSDAHGDRLIQVCESCESIWRKENPARAAEFDEE